MFLITRTNLSLKKRWKLMWLRKRFPWLFFVPNRPQADIIRVIGEQYNDKRIFLMTSGNGTGKTSATINIIANIVFDAKNIFRNVKDPDTGNEFPSGFFDYPLYQHFPSGWPKNIWYVSNRDSLSAIWDEFKVWIPERLMKWSKNGKTHVDEVAFKGTDFRLYFKTVDQDSKTFESANISMVIFDEPPPLALFRAALFRLRKGGIIIIPATPLITAAWFVDEIIDRVKLDNDKYHQTVSMWDNCRETCGNWDLGPDYGLQPKGVLFQRDIEFMIRNCDPDEMEARIHGKFQHLSGLVYKTYDSARHFVNLKVQHDPRRFVYKFVLDPHDRRPPACVWIRIDQWQRHRVIREWPSRSDPQYHHLPFHKIKDAAPYVLDDFVRFWCEIEEELRIPIDRIQSIIDPNYGLKPNLKTGKKLFQEYEEAFRKFGRPRGFILDAVDDLATGHQAVKDMLKPNQYGDSQLAISRACRNCDWGMRTYAYEPEPTGRAAEKRDLSLKVREIGKDFPDLLRYAAVVDYKWFPMPERESPYGDDYDYEGRDSQAIGERGEGADFV